jgi:hypothetical protein
MKCKIPVTEMSLVPFILQCGLFPFPLSYFIFPFPFLHVDVEEMFMFNWCELSYAAVILN